MVKTCHQIGGKSTVQTVNHSNVNYSHATSKHLSSNFLPHFPTSSLKHNDKSPKVTPMLKQHNRES